MPKAGDIRVVCANSECSRYNQPRFRKYDSCSDWACNFCGTRLVIAQNSKILKQNERAKRELQELGSL